MIRPRSADMHAFSIRQVPRSGDRKRVDPLPCDHRMEPASYGHSRPTCRRARNEEIHAFVAKMIRESISPALNIRTCPILCCCRCCRCASSQTLSCCSLFITLWPAFLGLMALVVCFGKVKFSSERIILIAGHAGAGTVACRRCQKGG